MVSEALTNLRPVLPGLGDLRGRGMPKNKKVVFRLDYSRASTALSVCEGMEAQK